MFYLLTKKNICAFQKIFIIIFLAFFNSLSHADPILQIIGFGDSITSGRPYSDIIGSGRQGYGGYEPFLEQLYLADGKTVYVYNWGYGGETTPVGVNRIDSVLNAQVSDYVLIMEGTNDQWYGISHVTTAFNLGVMVEKCQNTGTKPLLANLTPADRDTANQIPNVYNPAIEEVAKEKRAAFVDHYAAVVDRWDELAYDPVHPNLEGYEAIAQTWFNALKNYYNLVPHLPIGAIELLLLN